jgi:acyl-CoA synthetase (NDP forming)
VLQSSSELSLAALLAPRSILIYGASTDPVKIGGRPLHYMQDAGYAGRLFAVNPKSTQVQGIASHPNARSIHEPVDLAVIAVPAAGVCAAVDDCAEAGVRAAVIFSAGFAETGEQGRLMEAAAVASARRGGMRLLGPNCLGLFNSHTGCMATFTSTLEHAKPKQGPLAIVSQSGAIGSHLFVVANQRGLGIGTWVTTGNECDVDVADCLLHLADDPNTQAALIYLEGVKNGRKLVRALDAMHAAGKPVVAMKVGTSAIGAAAAASHTASLAGSDAIFDAVLRESGAYRVESIEDAIDAAYILAPAIRPAGRRLGVMTISGGAGVMMSDVAELCGLSMPPLPLAAQNRLAALLQHSGVRNPVDTTGRIFSELALVGTTIETMLECCEIDAIVCFFSSIGFSTTLFDEIRNQILSARKRFPDRLIVLSMLCSSDVRAEFEAVGLLVFEDPSRAVSAIGVLCEITERLRTTRSLPPPPMQAITLPSKASSEFEALDILRAVGIEGPLRAHANDVKEASLAASKIGFPVVLKISSPGIAHKSDIGGVVIGLKSSEAVEEAGNAMLASLHRQAADAKVDGFLVAAMVPDGVEVILGVSRDPTFGPIVMLGSGGVLAELLGDVTFRMAPFGETTARRMIQEVRIGRLLAGFRGRPPGDIDALAAALVKLSAFAFAHQDRLDSLDINPLKVLPAPNGVVALDALINLNSED